MAKVNAKAKGPSGVVSLLDWYDLPEELILVLERPAPCLDLIDYLHTCSSSVQEHKAKVGCLWLFLTLAFIAAPSGAESCTVLMSLAIIPTQNIIKQLVNALIEIHSRGVFHRDIKLENILIETGSEAPRIWVIDFGCATFLTEGKDTTVQGWFSVLGCASMRQKQHFQPPCGCVSLRNSGLHLSRVVPKQVLPRRAHYCVADWGCHVPGPS